MHDIGAAQEAVQDVIAQYVRQQRLYRQWDDFCATLLFNPNIHDISIPCIAILQVYSHRVQHAKYSKLRMGRLGKESVSGAWGLIARSHFMDGLPDPRKPAKSQSHTGLDKRLARKLKTYGL